MQIWKMPLPIRSQLSAAGDGFILQLGVLNLWNAYLRFDGAANRWQREIAIYSCGAGR